VDVQANPATPFAGDHTIASGAMTLLPRTWPSAMFGEEQLRARREPVSVCLPALNEVETIGPIVARLARMQEDRLIDEVIVVDGGSDDGTADEARAAGADVYGWGDLQPDLGPFRGKGDSMWRGLRVTRGDLVCYLDADLRSFGEHYVYGVVGPLVVGSEVDFVKSTFARPLRVPDLPAGAVQGGRVTEATARPMLSLFYPPLAGFRQPLSGQIAARRGLLESIPFSTGYAVDVGLLIDVYKRVGLVRMAQIDVGELVTVHQDLDALAIMARDVATAIVVRAERDGIVSGVNTKDYVRIVDGELLVSPAEIIDRPAIVVSAG